MTVGIIDDEQKPCGCPADHMRGEATHFSVPRRNPEHSLANSELSHDVIALTDEVLHCCAESEPVKADRIAGSLDPQLRLDTRHTPRRAKTLRWGDASGFKPP